MTYAIHTLKMHKTDILEITNKTCTTKLLTLSYTSYIISRKLRQREGEVQCLLLLNKLLMDFY
jgi:hypothetical protein